MPLFLFLIVYIMLEGYVILLVANALGFLPTLLLLFLSAFLGVYLVRQRGLTCFARANAALLEGRMPGLEILEGILTVVAGVILIIPGFVSDFLVLVMLLPFVLRSLSKLMLRHFDKARERPRGFSSSTFSSGQDNFNSSQTYYQSGTYQSSTGQTSAGGPLVFYKFFVYGAPFNGSNTNQGGPNADVTSGVSAGKGLVIDCTPSEDPERHQNSPGQPFGGAMDQEVGKKAGKEPGQENEELPGGAKPDKPKKDEDAENGPISL